MSLHRTVEAARKRGLDTTVETVEGWWASSRLHSDFYCAKAIGPTTRTMTLDAALTALCRVCGPELWVGDFELAEYAHACRQVLDLCSDLSSRDIERRGLAVAKLGEPGESAGPGDIGPGDQSLSRWLEGIRDDAAAQRSAQFSAEQRNELLATCASLLLPNPNPRILPAKDMRALTGALESARAKLLTDRRWVLASYDADALELGSTPALIICAWRLRGGLAHMPRVAFEALVAQVPTAVKEAVKLPRPATPDTLEAVASLREPDGIYSRLATVFKAASAL